MVKYTAIAFAAFSAIGASVSASSMADDRDTIIRNLMNAQDAADAKFEAFEAKNNELEAKNNELEAKNNALEDKINVLEAQVSTKIKSDKVLRRRELGTSAWHEAVDDLKDKVEKVTQGMRQLYIEENLATGESVTVYEAGPIKVEASCGGTGFCSSSTEVCLVLTLFDANEDLQVFGDIEDDSGLDDYPIVNNVLPANTEYKEEMWQVSSTGNDTNDGAVWIGGYYLGWDGDSFIGLKRDDGLLIGGNCQIAGVFNYFIPKDHEHDW